MQEIIRENLGSKEFFINKAIGWALRQHTRVDPRGVRKFVAETPLHPLSAREALKWLEKPRETRTESRGPWYSPLPILPERTVFIAAPPQSCCKLTTEADMVNLSP
jgi:hypothetical protein